MLRAVVGPLTDTIKCSIALPALSVRWQLLHAVNLLVHLVPHAVPSPVTSLVAALLSVQLANLLIGAAAAAAAHPY